MPLPAARFLWNYTPLSLAYTQESVTMWGPGQAQRPMTLPRFAPVGGYSQPSTSVELPSDYHKAFGGDFYERWHFSSLNFVLGNLVGNQTRELKVWNAHRRARILESLTLIDGEGIIISGQPSPPLQFAPLQQRAYSLEITTEGPPTVDARLVFDFDLGQTTTIAITGSRVTPWPWQPDWSQGVGEVLEWMTDITESENGSEQATAMRLSPRRSMDFNVGAEGKARQAMEVALAGWSGRVWSLPVWPDEQLLQTPVSAGSVIIPAATIGRDFYPGGLAMLLGADFRDYEVVEVLTQTASQIELKRPTVRTWPAGTALYPARASRLNNGATLSRFTGDMHTARARFDMVGPCDWPELTGLPMYRGLPVLEDQPEWSQEPTMAIARKLAVRDNRYGRPDYVDRADVPIMRQVHRWSPLGRAQLARLRSLLYLLRGKWGAIWVPSWANDFTLALPASAATSALDVDWTGYSLYTNALRNRRDLRISTPTTVQYARIATASELTPQVERLGIDTPLSTSLTPTNATIQYLTLWRLDTDRLEFAWWTGDYGNDSAHADVPMPMRTFRHDL